MSTGKQLWKPTLAARRRLASTHPLPADVAMYSSLARSDCQECLGTGRAMHALCGCVYRHVFTATLRNYWRLSGSGPSMAMKVGKTGISFGYPSIEFVADFESTARRALGVKSLEYSVYQYHIKERLQWRECLWFISRKMHRPIDRGTFFHALYRAQGRLGKAFLKGLPGHPVALWPLTQYFTGHAIGSDQLGSVPLGLKLLGVDPAARKLPFIALQFAQRWGMGVMA